MLIKAGVPVVAVGPKDIPRQSGWASITAPESRLDLYREGDALAMVCGHGIDVIDVDPKNGGNRSHLPVPFKHFGTTRTPSGGEHYIVPSTGVGTMTLSTLIGHVGDYCGGHPDGTSRGLAFLPGSRRTKYPEGGYVMEEPWDIAGCLAAEGELALAATLADAGGSVERHAEHYVDDSEERNPSLGVHPYAASAIAGELARLTECQDLGWDGPPWDNTTFSVACKLVEFANSGWTGYSLEDAEQDLLSHAPTDENFGEANHRMKLNSAVNRVDGGGRKPPAEGGADFTPEGPEYDPHSLLDAHVGVRIGVEYLADRLIAWGNTGWAAWDGKRWDLEATTVTALGVVREALLDVVRIEAQRADDQRNQAGNTEQAMRAHEARMKQIRGLLNIGKMQAVTTVARTAIEHRVEEFDQARDYLNCGNGIVHLRTGEISRHDPRMMFTQATTVDYVPGAEHPDWDKALRAMPTEVADWMQLRFGQAATGYAPDDDLIPFLKGGGANGKTTVLLGVRKALGDFARPVPEKVLLAGQNDHPTELFDLKGRRFVYIEELPASDWVNVARLKRITGTETGLTARPLYQKNVTWEPTHSLMVTTNYETQITDTDHGTWRRLARVMFPYTFTGPDLDSSLRARLRDGADQHRAVLAWIVAGALRYFRGGLERERDMPQVVKEDTYAWRNSTNVPVQFLDEMFTLDSTGAIPTNQVYAMFAAWLSEHGRRALADQTFWDRAKEHPWFTEGKVERGKVRPGSWKFPSDWTPKSNNQMRLLTGVALSDEGLELRFRAGILM